MLFLGCDPDMHSMAFATVNEKLAIQWVGLIRVPNKSKEQAASIEMIQLLSVFDVPGAEGNYPNRIMAGAVESQEIYLTGPNKTKDPRNILHLGHVAGAALAVAAGVCNCRTVYFPVPVKWKGSRDKLAHHHHILQRAGNVPSEAVKEMGGKDPYCTVDSKLCPIPGAQALNPSDWKHVLDAVGLAQYAAETYLFQTKKEELLARARSS